VTLVHVDDAGVDLQGTQGAYVADAQEQFLADSGAVVAAV